MTNNTFKEVTQLRSSNGFAKRLSKSLTGNFTVLSELKGDGIYLAEKAGGEICEYCGERTENLFAHLLDDCSEIEAESVSGKADVGGQQEYDLEDVFDSES